MPRNQFKPSPILIHLQTLKIKKKIIFYAINCKKIVRLYEVATKPVPDTGASGEILDYVNTMAQIFVSLTSRGFTVLTVGFFWSFG